MKLLMLIRLTILWRASQCASLSHVKARLSQVVAAAQAPQRLRRNLRPKADSVFDEKRARFLALFYLSLRAQRGNLLAGLPRQN
jgi:hypothetical protein